MLYVVLLVLERRLALLGECCHTLLLVVCREQGLEQTALKTNALGEGEFVG